MDYLQSSPRFCPHPRWLKIQSARTVQGGKLRWNQAHIVSECAQLSCPVVHRAACFHGDRARFQIRESVRESLARARFPYDDMLDPVERMNLHDVLRQIHANTSNLVHDIPFAEGCVALDMMTPDGADLAIGEVLTNSDHDCDWRRESCRAWLAKAPIIGA